MDYLKLKTELESDPLTLGYSGMSNAQAATKLNDTTVRSIQRTIIPAYEVFEAIVPTEWAALAAQEKQRVQTIVSMGQVNVQGANTRSSLAAAFGAGTTSRTNLAALQTQLASRATELGLGQVLEVDVQRARAGSW